jgi:DNA-binding transcriptional ArsR family regulator
MGPETAQRAAIVLKAVAHPVRLRIIELLKGGEKCVGDIFAALEIKQSITSQHLNMMRDKQVLTCRREGAKVYYRIQNPNVIKLLQCMQEICNNGKGE